MSAIQAASATRPSVPFPPLQEAQLPEGLTITPTGGPVGAVVSGVDTSRPLAAETILALKQAWAEHLILIFKDQLLSDEQYIRFATYFGNIFYPPDDVPVLASTLDGKTPPIVLVANVEGGYTGSGELAPHIDHHWTPYPSKASFLYALEVPKEGGETYWSNLYQVYEDLDAATKRRIEGLQLITYNPFKRKAGEPRPRYRDFSLPPASQAFPHPLVATHPETGRKLLYLDYATEVEVPGLAPEEGAALIAALRKHLHQPKYYYRHPWSVGDIVLWDNLSTLHYRPAFDPAQRRVLKRISLAAGGRSDMGLLHGKTALVTGAGKGIGRAIALGYAGAGAKVGLLARTAADLEAAAAEHPQSLLPLPADVTDQAALEQAFAQCAAAYGGLDILVINAGGGGEPRRLEDSDPARWWQVLEVNLFGAYLTAKAGIPYLKQRGGGHIILLGSGMGHRAMPGGSAYASAKAGLSLLGKVLAEELREAAINVNELIPGPVETNADPTALSSVLASPEGSVEWLKQPEDVVPLALFLASQPRLGPTGQIFSLNRRIVR